MSNTWNRLTVYKQMSFNSLKKNNVTYKLITYKLYLYLYIYIYKVSKVGDLSRGWPYGSPF